MSTLLALPWVELPPRLPAQDHLLKLCPGMQGAQLLMGPIPTGIKSEVGVQCFRLIQMWSRASHHLVCSSSPADTHLWVCGLPPVCLAEEPLQCKAVRPLLGSPKGLSSQRLMWAITWPGSCVLTNWIPSAGLAWSQLLQSPVAAKPCLVLIFFPQIFTMLWK